MYTSDLGTAAKKGFATLWNDMTQNNRKSTEAIHGIQKALQCCGNTAATDWLSIEGGVPSSCCVEGANTCNELTAFSNGCGTQLYDIVSSSGKLIAWIAVSFAVFEV